MADLKVAGYDFTFDQAKAVVADYCFGEEMTQPDPPVPAYGEPRPAWRRARFGYRSYDCQRGPGEGIDIIDIVAPVAAASRSSRARVVGSSDL